jgi:hypothetical protein
MDIVKHILRNIIPLSSVAFIQTTVAAHPGHGEGGAAHYVTEPQHAVVNIAAMVSLLLVAFVVIRVIGPARLQQNR